MQFIYLNYRQSCLLLINSFETGQDQRQLFLSCAGRQKSHMSNTVLICVKQDICMRIVALDYTATVVISCSTIFQDTLSHPKPYSSFQHALHILWEDLMDLVLLPPKIVRRKIREIVRLSGTALILGISFIQPFCLLSNEIEATYKRNTNKPKLARDKKAEILCTVGRKKPQFVPSKKDLVAVCAQ